MSGDKKRRLTLKQAQACENALNPRCRCRCGGAMHGAKRGLASGYAADELPPREWFEDLPDADPHRIRSEEEREKRGELAAEIRQLRRRLKLLEHDRARLLELGHTRLGAELEARIKDVGTRIEWLRGRAHAT